METKARAASERTKLESNGRISIFGFAQNLREMRGELGTGHDLAKTGGFGLSGEVRLDVRQKTDEGNAGVCGAEAFDGGEGLVASVEIDDDEPGKRVKKLKERVGIGSELHFDAEMPGGFGQLHLKEKIVHVGDNASHTKGASVDTSEVCTERWDAGRRREVNHRLEGFERGQPSVVAEILCVQEHGFFMRTKSVRGEAA